MQCKKLQCVRDISNVIPIRQKLTVVTNFAVNMQRARADRKFRSTGFLNL